MRGERERVADRVREVLGVPRPEADGRHRWRWDPGRRGVAAIGAVTVVAAVLALWWVTRAQPSAVPVTSLGGSLTAAASLPSSASSALTGAPGATAARDRSPSASTALIVVDVAGKVSRPGIYRLPAGSRVDDALRAAGGVRDGVDTTSINLAAPLQDGQQVAVGVTGAPAALPGPLPGAGSGGGVTAPAAVINLNSATLAQLDSLPGVGPVLAQHIVDWRSEHGRFSSITQLNDVSGIGAAKFAELRARVSV